MADGCRPAEACRAVSVRGGGRGAGQSRNGRLGDEDDLDYAHEFEHVTLARVLLAQYELERDRSVLARATAALNRLLHAAEAGGRTGTVIGLLVLLAVAQEHRGDTAAALEMSVNIAAALPSCIAPAIAPAILFVGGGSYSLIHGVVRVYALLGSAAVLPIRQVC